MVVHGSDGWFCPLIVGLGSLLLLGLILKPNHYVGVT